MIFNIFRNRMHEEPDFVRRIAASYQFNVMLNGKFVTTWSKLSSSLSCQAEIFTKTIDFSF